MENQIKAHLADRIRLGQSPATLSICEKWLRDFAISCKQRERTLDNLQESDFEAFHQQLLWTPRRQGRLLGQSAVYQALYTVRTFLRWCLAQGHLPQDITRDWQFGRGPNPQPALLTRAQLDAILQGPDQDTPSGLRDLALLRVYCELGLQRSACHQLDMVDLDLPARRLKSDRLGIQTLEVLQRYVLQGRPALLVNPDEPALFLCGKGQRFQNHTSRYLLARYSTASTKVLHLSWTAHRHAMLARRLP